MRLNKKKSLLAIFLAVLAPGTAFAAESSYPMAPMDPDLQDLPSLQNGFRLYVNYCIGCHSLEWQRYERTANDLEIPHDIVTEQLIFTDQKIGDKMVSAMDREAAKNWFGAPPPDLTMVARVRSPEWIYNYLSTFYVDDTRPLGVNNKVFVNVGMPHALAELQGVQRLDCAADVPPAQCDQLVVEAGSGLYTPEEYDQAVYDIANFLYYTGDPSRLERHRIGIYVLLFLLILYAFTWLLGREYHKAVK